MEIEQIEAKQKQVEFLTRQITSTSDEQTQSRLFREIWQLTNEIRALTNHLQQGVSIQSYQPPKNLIADCMGDDFTLIPSEPAPKDPKLVSLETKNKRLNYILFAIQELETKPKTSQNIDDINKLKKELELIYVS